MTLDRLPAGSRVFVDSTIFIYHAAGASLQCRSFLERCEAGEIKGVTSVVALAETAHRLMMIEAVIQGLVSAKDVPKRLRARPDIVRKLHVYQEQVERIPLMGIEVVSVGHDVLLASAEVRRQHGLLVNDSLIVAAARAAGIATLASADRDFARVKGLIVYGPADL